jgi:hypothetical protein
VQPALICTPGSDDNVEVNGVKGSTVQSLIYKKIFKWESDVLHIKCTVTANNTSELVDVWTTQFVTGDVEILSIAVFYD